MTIPAGNRFTITITQIKGSGYPRVVRLFKKGFLVKRLVSSDWFLDVEQAKRFADQLASDLQNDSGLQNVRSRKPGWVLKRAGH